MKTTTLLTIALFVVAAVAAPAMADDGPETDEKSKKNADRGYDKADRYDADKAQEKRDAAMEKREAHQAKHDERRNATIAKAQERCDAYEERTGRDVPACDDIDDVHDASKVARRAAHALIKAIDALEHRVVTLEKLEVKFMEKLESENLTANETAAYEAKLVRIQAAQNATLEKLEKMEQRLEHLKEKWQKVRDHVKDHHKVLICHQGDDGEKTLRVSGQAARAHLSHGDSQGACEDPATDVAGDEPASTDAASDDPSGEPSGDSSDAGESGNSEDPEADPAEDPEADPAEDPEGDGSEDPEADPGA